MIPITPKLYAADSTTFLGLLPNCTACRVTEELNGIYELYAELPQTPENIALLLPGRYISAKPGDGAAPQLFRIYSVEKNLSGRLVVDAEHISYLLNAYPVDAATGTGLTCTAAMNLLLSRAAAVLGKSHGFTAWSNSTVQSSIDLNAVSVRAGLGGVQGSVLQKFRVEYEWDGKIVRAWSRRGADNGVKIAYRKNLTGLTASTSVDESYTGLFPWAKFDDAFVILPEKVLKVTAPGIAERYLVKDFTQELQGGGTADDLRTAAQAWLNVNDIASPALTLNVKFIDLSQSSEYAEYKDLERVRLGDSVRIYHEPLGVDATARVTKVVYNTLTEQYDSITVGRVKADMGSTLQQLRDEISSIELDVPDIALIQQIINQAVDDATNAITGASGGKIILNPPHNPQELLILTDGNDTIQTARRLWRFNSGGLGYSSNGYNGPYATAITADGKIVADFITTGTLVANLIKAGVLTDAAGKFSLNMTTGAASLSGATITGGSVSIGGSAFRTDIAAGALSQYALGDGTFICGLTPFSSGNEYRPTIYIGSDSRVTGFSISYQSGINIINIAEFDKTEIDLMRPVKISSNVTTNTAQNTTFAAVQHYRDVSGFGVAMMKLGCGSLTASGTKFASAALEVGAVGYTTPAARLDIFPSWGSAAMCLRGMGDGVTSGVLELGSTTMWWRGSEVAVTSAADVKRDIAPAPAALEKILAAGIYTYTFDTSANPVSVDDGETEAPQPDTQTHTGFVIGDGYTPPPAEVIGEDGASVNLYAALAMAWKGIQELSAQVDELKAEIQALEGGS